MDKVKIIKMVYKGTLNTHEDAIHYYTFTFTIEGDNEDWPKIEIGITNKVLVGWWITTGKQMNLSEFISSQRNKFLLQISPHIIKRGINDNDILKIKDGETIVSYLFAHPEAKLLNQELQLFVRSTPEKTIEHYKKEPEEILVRKEKTC